MCPERTQQLDGAPGTIRTSDPRFVVRCSIQLSYGRVVPPTRKRPAGIAATSDACSACVGLGFFAAPFTIGAGLHAIATQRCLAPAAGAWLRSVVKHPAA